ncbi:hypothetical protein DPEC_G00030220 [Dallia pectoralis]|uniref:Uncharacterized protein n=1 Tax=Dallia pectoralis TaxID=75939 RepID=A0ACC2HBX7_DALPE|nr:hypothetical protein DPEC_G00030220 [Dallia pectoralis]
MRKYARYIYTDGASLSELSWSSSLAVVAVSLSGLFIFVFLMLACLCCKKGHTGFKEFENAEGEEFQTEQSTLVSPASQRGPDVYILPLTEVSLPLANQPGRSVQLLKSADICRHSLLYLKEIGDGWFGKVLLAEINAGLSTSQVVVKELKASASVQDQMHFLEEAQPYRILQHPALLQCLAQCSDVTPYLLAMEFCHLGDVKGYLQSCQAADSVTPEPLILQRMACEIASGLQHLHKHSFIHSDLALRNCLLTSDLTVKIGDYGLSQKKYKDDYLVTLDQVYVPLRWIAPELIDEVHGNILVVNQSKESNVWSLGVTIWELFEMGNQPYGHYSDRQVLTYAVKEQQLRLPKPLIKTPLVERWYEVMQFCWLQPDQRPAAEEVHMLLSYLCAKGQSDAEEDFERRWHSLRPLSGPTSSLHQGTMAIDQPSSSSSSAFPLLEQFSGCDGYHSETGDDILTVTETSRGLNFEYKWEQAGAERGYHHGASASRGSLGAVNPHCQEPYYPTGPGGRLGGCGGAEFEGLTLGVSPSYYKPKPLRGSGVGVVPVLSAHSPSVSSEYYIRIKEPGGDFHVNMDLDYTMCSYSPDYQGSNGSFLTGSGSADSGDCMMGMGHANIDSYWSADIHKVRGVGVYDSDLDGSPTISLTMEPLLGQVSESSPLRPWEAGHYVSYKDRDGGYYYEHSSPVDSDYQMGLDHHQHCLMGRGHPEPNQESWGSRSLRQALGELENPLGMPPSISGHPQSEDPHFDVGGSGPITGGYYDMMGSLRKSMPGHSHSVSITMASEEALFISHPDSDSDEEDIFLERCGTWPSKLSNRSVNSAGLGLSLSKSRQTGYRPQQEAYVDFHYTMPTTDIEDSWPETFHSVPAEAKPKDYLESRPCPAMGKLHTLIPSEDSSNAYIYLCHDREEDGGKREGECCHSHFIEPLTGLVVQNFTREDYRDQMLEINNQEEDGVDLSPAPGGPAVSKSTLTQRNNTKPLQHTEQYVDHSMELTPSREYKQEVGTEDKGVLTDPKPQDGGPTNPLGLVPLVEPESELSQTFDSGLDRDHCSSISLVDISDCCTDEDEDDDITDVTSGIFADEALVGEMNASSSLIHPIKSLQKQLGNPDSMDSMDLPAVAGTNCEAFSPASSTSQPSSSSPKAMDSGYDTENNKSPEFIPKDPHNEPPDPETFTEPLGESILDNSLDEEGEEGGEEAEVATLEDEDVELEAFQTTELSKKNPYRDSAYFSDYENERISRDEGDEKVDHLENVRVKEKEEGKKADEDSRIEKFELYIEEKIEEEELDEEDGNEEQKTSALRLKDSDDPENERCQTEDSPQHKGLEPGLDLAFNPFGDTEAESEVWFAQEEPLTLEDWVAEVVGAMEEALGELQRSSRIETSSGTKEVEEIEEDQEETEQRNVDYPSETLEKACNGKTPDKDDGYQDNGPLSGRFHCSSSPPPPSTHPPSLTSMTTPMGRVSSEDGEEADEEDEDGESDDSESDEELRSYSIQDEQSEEENHAIPIVLSDCSDAHNLRSLLKMPTLLSAETLAGDLLERKKKVVSFFDDVTVYLFDQQSPTKELAESGFPSVGDVSGHGPEAKQPTSDDSSDGNISEESCGYEWEDDFPLFPLSTSSSKMAASSDPSPPNMPSSKAPDLKPAVQFSRFTVSPSHASRFSITHVSDSDMDSGPGSSEDGDRD